MAKPALPSDVKRYLLEEFRRLNQFAGAQPGFPEDNPAAHHLMTCLMSLEVAILYDDLERLAAVGAGFCSHIRRDITE